MSWCFEDETPAYGDAILQELEQSPAYVPAMWPLEVANVLAVGERRGRLTPADSARFLELVTALPLTVDLETPARTFKDVLPVARQCGLSVYDAAYLELAMRYEARLATLDAVLGQAAEAVGITLYA